MGSMMVTDPRKQRLLIVSISFASFIVNVDTYIVNISLPEIAHFFHVDLGFASWIVLTYHLAITCTILIFGRLGDKLGLKRNFILGFVIFTVSSLLCAVSLNIWHLIIGRFLQGLGASILYAMPPAMITRFLPSEKRGYSFGILQTATALGIMLGAPLGGILTGWFTWRSIFFVNLPVGILAIWVCSRIIPDDRQESAGGRTNFDIPGSVLSLLFLVTLIYGLDQLDAPGVSRSALLALFLASIVLLALFVLRESRAADPLLDLSILRNREFSFGNIAGALTTAYLAGNNFLIPFYLDLMKGLSTENSGFVFMVYSMTYIICSPILGKLSDRRNPRTLCVWAMCVCAANALAFSWTLLVGGLWPVLVFFIFNAFAFSLFFPANNNVVMGMAPPGQQGAVAGLYRMINRVGMTLGVGVFQIVFSLSVSDGGPLEMDALHGLSSRVLASGFRHAYFGAFAACCVAVLFSLAARRARKNEPA